MRLNLVPVTAFLFGLWICNALPAPASAQEYEGATFRLRPWASFVFTGTDPHLQLTPIHRDIRGSDQVDPAARALVGIDLEIGLGRHLTVGLKSHYDTDPTNNPLARTRKLGPLEAGAELDEAFVTLAGGLGELTLGRKQIGWGYSPMGSLTLPGYAPGIDLVKGRINLPWGHRLESFLGRLSSEEGRTRLLYGHRWVLSFADVLTVGGSNLTIHASETVELSCGEP